MLIQRDALLENVRRGQQNRSEDFPVTYTFTNGAFRCLHFGHLACLREAMTLGSVLIVGVNSDQSLLASGRSPIQNEQQRLAVVDAVLKWDNAWVLLFDEPTPEKLIEAIRPDVLVKGGDYKGQDIPGAAFVRSYGGRVHFTRYVEGISTTKLLASG